MRLNNDYLQTKHPWISLATRHLGIQRENSHMNTNTYTHTHTLQEMTQASTHCSVRSIYSSHWAVSAPASMYFTVIHHVSTPLCPSILVLQPERASTVCLCVSLKARLCPNLVAIPLVLHAYCNTLLSLPQNQLTQAWRHLPSKPPVELLGHQSSSLHTHTHACTNTLTKNTTPG